MLQSILVIPTPETDLSPNLPNLDFVGMKFKKASPQKDGCRLPPPPPPQDFCGTFSLLHVIVTQNPTGYAELWEASPAFSDPANSSSMCRCFPRELKENQERKSSPKRKFSGRTSRERPGVIRADVPGQKLWAGPRTLEKHAFRRPGSFVRTSRVKNFGQAPETLEKHAFGCGHP